MNDQQKLALGVGGIGVVALLYLRSHKPARAAPPQPTTGNVAPFTPQSPVILSPGESVYDPNSQGFLTSPLTPDTGGSNVTVMPPEQGVPFPPPPQTTAPSAPSHVPVSHPPNPKQTKNRHAPRKRRPTVTRPTGKHHPIPKPKPKVKRKVKK